MDGAFIAGQFQVAKDAVNLCLTRTFSGNEKDALRYEYRAKKAHFHFGHDFVNCWMIVTKILRKVNMLHICVILKQMNKRKKDSFFINCIFSWPFVLLQSKYFCTWNIKAIVSDNLRP